MSPSILLLCLMALPSQGEDPPPPMRRAGPYSGLVATSSFEADGKTWDLEVGYAFPDRARHRMSPRGDRSTARRLTFRYGKALWTIAPGQASSQVVSSLDRGPILRRLELRRALLLWPHDLPWEGSGPERRANLDGSVGGAALIRALLDPATGRPHTLEALGEQGQLFESLTEITWGKPGPGGETWPIQLTLRDGQRTLRVEEVSTVTPARLFERYFQPTDRRAGSGTPKLKPRSFDLPAATGRRLPLEEGLSLKAALAHADALIAEAVVANPGEILPEPVLLLDHKGRPLEVWIQRQLGPAPTGWEERAACEAIGLFLPSPEELTPQRSTELFKAAARDGRSPGVLFLRAQEAGPGPRRAELVLTVNPR